MYLGGGGEVGGGVPCAHDQESVCLFVNHMKSLIIAKTNLQIDEYASYRLHWTKHRNKMAD